jgi:CheY-like chemotaxis protein
MGHTDLRGLTILVVEDDPDTRELIEVVLERAGARVVTAGDARQALQLVQDRTPDLILSDVGLPDEDGRAFIRKVRELKLRVPAAAVTAYDEEADNLAAGFDRHLRKPVDYDRLLRVVVELVGAPPHASA